VPAKQGTAICSCFGGGLAVDGKALAYARRRQPTLQVRNLLSRAKQPVPTKQGTAICSFFGGGLAVNGKALTSARIRQPTLQVRNLLSRTKSGAQIKILRKGCSE